MAEYNHTTHRTNSETTKNSTASWKKGKISESKKLENKSKHKIKQGKPVTVQVAQNVPTIVFKNVLKLFKISVTFSSWCDKKI